MTILSVEQLALGSLELRGHGQRVGQEPFPWQWQGTYNGRES